MFETAMAIILSLTAIALAVFVVANILIPDFLGLRKDPVMPRQQCRKQL